MSIEVVRFRREHLAKLHERKETASIAITPETLDMLEKDQWTGTLIVGGQVILCGGVVRYWDGRGEAWAVVSEEASKYAVTVVRVVKRFLDQVQNAAIRRLEATVEHGFKMGERLVEILGFEVECPCLRKYYATGADATLYVRFRNG